MGLAEPRKRQKISRDPNNTLWSHDTSTYGHKILSRQGWSPGIPLNPSSTHLSTSHRSASRVKIVYKDDNLGLGADRGKMVGEDDGGRGDLFAGLLGRLNGKGEEEVERESEREKRKRAERWVAGRRGKGWMEFVRGGVLVQGDDFKGTESKEEEKGEKEKVAVVDGSVKQAEEEVLDEKAAKNRRKEEKRRRKEEKRLRREARESKGAEEREETLISAHRNPPTQSQPELSTINPPTPSNPPQKTKSKKRKFLSTPQDLPPQPPLKISSPPSTSISTPPPPPTKTPPAPTGRHLLRGRAIAQKRAAFTDAEALNGVFWVKA
ncbi:MAG: hypothetical protein Q9227_008280 [Pyrenula ochraceoflavens]